jgi:agmatinase
MTKRAVSVGIRDMSIEESEYIKREGIASSIHGIGFDADRIAAQLSDYVYITIDLDGFDPSEIPAVGTPQPGGLHWATVLKLLRKIAEKKNIVGFDVVELSPIKGQIASEFTAAKLVYKLIGYSLLEK